MNITKLKLSRKISDEVEISLEDSKKFVDAFFMKKTNFLNESNLKVSKFGTFLKKITPQRIGRNPKTLEEHIIPEKIKISFRASRIIKDIIN